MPDLRKLENDSIHSFVESCGDLYRGARVLDYGCGRQPYKDLIESFGAEYVGYDRASFPGNTSGVDVLQSRVVPLRGPWNVILCTQVLQYVEPVIAGTDNVWIDGVVDLLDWLAAHLADTQGHLVLTGPTNWPEVEETDHQRLTVAGIRARLEHVGFTVERLESRASIEWQGERFSLGWGAVGRA